MACILGGVETRSEVGVHTQSCGQYVHAHKICLLLRLTVTILLYVAVS